jgi:hypothetical protein
MTVKTIPAVAKLAAAFVFVAAMVAYFFLVNGHDVFGILTCALIGTLLAGYILLAGYVYGDARRRGMPAGVWTAMVILVPNAIGFVLYFLLRKPLVHPCPACGCGVTPDAAFCPKCGQPQAAACRVS